MKKKLLRICLLFILFQNTSIFAWHLVYHHDVDGKKISGSIEGLINGINEGHKVRIMLIDSSMILVYDTTLIWVKNGIVYGENNEHISAVFNNNILKHQSDPHFVYKTFDTNGNINRTVVERTGGSVWSDSSKSEMKWFID